MTWNEKEIVGRLASIEAQTDKRQHSIDAKSRGRKVTRPLHEAFRSFGHNIFYRRRSVVLYIAIGMLLGTFASARSDIAPIYWAGGGACLAAAIHVAVRRAIDKRDSHYRS